MATRKHDAIRPWNVVLMTGIRLDVDVAGEELTRFDTLARKGWMNGEEQLDLYELACDLLDALRREKDK